ncbi:hypothetical protein LZK98_11800 [Sphingomonas cannabina]|uniref:hypothetical protein n=1 Tax=Sphingomonas cannabina TaxID=2899123 RepID=UPI001F233BC6|nr:hypothetical protein [Sphingomonas cannabina]UIJ43775.1 hypothetical protein LZK98_11800 [Sphingomonas cannabina]
MKADRPLTPRQCEALLAAEDTLFGDTKIAPGYGRMLRGLRLRGLIEGDVPHVYLTDDGKSKLSELAAS